MKHRGVVPAWLVAASLGLTLPTWPAVPERSPHAVLAEAKELEKPVTYTETKVPLGELVQKVAADTGAKLTAAPDVADEPVAVVVKDLPARELLEQLADLLDYQWIRHPPRPAPNPQGPIHPLRGYPNAQPPAPTYEIWQDLPSKQREAALRDASIAEVEKQFREQLKLYEEVAALPSDEFQRLVAAAEKDRKERGDLTLSQQAALLRDPQQRAQRLRLFAALALQPPLYRSEALLLSRLTPSQWARLREEGSVTLSNNPQPGWLPLPAEIERLLRAASPTLLQPGAHLAFPNPAEEEKLFQRQKQLEEAWSAATGFQVSISLDSSRLKTQGGLDLALVATPYRNGAPLDLNFYTPGTELRLMGDARFTGQQYEEDTPGRRAALEADPLVGVPKRLEPAAKPRPNGNAPGAPGWWRLWDLLPDLARTYDVQFIADSYLINSPGLSEEELPKTPVALFSILDHAALSTHRWERRGKLIRLRDRTWFLDRPREVPLRFVRRWKQLFTERAALPLDTYTEMATSLTDAQMETLDWLVQGAALPPDLYSAGDCRHVLRLYSALSADQRQTLWRGELVPVTRMTPRQRTLFAAGLADSLRHDAPADRPQLLAAGSFGVTAASLIRVSERHEGIASFRDDPAPASVAAIPSGARGRFPVTRLRFHLRYGVDQTRSPAELTVANPP